MSADVSSVGRGNPTPQPLVARVVGVNRGPYLKDPSDWGSGGAYFDLVEVRDTAGHLVLTMEVESASDPDHYDEAVTKELEPWTAWVWDD